MDSPSGSSLATSQLRPLAVEKGRGVRTAVRRLEVPQASGDKAPRHIAPQSAALRTSAGRGQCCWRGRSAWEKINGGWRLGAGWTWTAGRRRRCGRHARCARVDLHIRAPSVEADVPSSAPLALLDGAREPQSTRLSRNDGAEFEEERAVPGGAVLRGRSGEEGDVSGCRADLCRRKGATDAGSPALHATLSRTLTGFMNEVAQ
jgi:hypothetical protein